MKASPLTQRGQEQAITIARSFTQAPELIVASPFARAQATARETSKVFLTVAVQTWPIVRVIAINISDDKLELARSLGAVAASSLQSSEASHLRAVVDDRYILAQRLIRHSNGRDFHALHDNGREARKLRHVSVSEMRVAQDTTRIQ